MVMTAVEQYLINKSKVQPVLGLIQGEPQVGKSSLFRLLANNISLYKDNEPWNYSLYCARSIHELLDMVKKYDGKILGYEEAGKDLDISTWYSATNRLFSYLIQTQGYKKNIIIMLLPCGLTIPTRHKRMVNIGINVRDKDESKKLVSFRGIIYKQNFERLMEEEPFFGYLPITFHIYTDEELAMCREYTDWLKNYKEIILDTMIENAKMIHKVDYDKKPEEKIIPIKLNWGNVLHS